MRAEIDEELRAHIDMRVGELMHGGLPDSEARREALRQFGDWERTTRYCEQEDMMKERQTARGLWMGEFLQDAATCLRGLLRAPTLTAAILLTVGLGIGATTAMFSAVHAVLLRPLPYPGAERLVRIYTHAPPNQYNFSVADYLTLEREQTMLEQVAGYVDRAMTFTDGVTAELVPGRVVSWSYFDLLGLRPAAGRTFTPADGQPGNPAAVIVSRGFWLHHLGGRADAIGKPVRFDGTDYVLAGVLPPAAGPLEEGREFFVAAQWTEPRRKGPFFLNTLGRLRRDSDRAAASSELQVMNRRMFSQWAASYQDDRSSWAMMDLKRHLVGRVDAIAGLATAAVALIWLIACANASSLLVARVTSRRRELAVRTALGASRGRIVRLLLAEGALLAAGAAVVGAGIAWVGIELLRNAGSLYLPRTSEIGFDVETVAVLGIVTAASAALFGLISATQGAGALEQSLRLFSRSTTGNVQARRGRRMLVGTQFAIATPLLVVAALLLTSLQQLNRVELGFDSRNVLTASIQLPGAQYQDAARVSALWNTLEARVRALPGVSSAAFADGRPPAGVWNFNNFDLEQYPTPTGHSQPVTPWISVTPGYFATLGVPLLEGRLLDDHDAVTPDDVIVVDRGWATRFFPGESAVGKRLKGGGCATCPWTTVVGVVGSVKYAGLEGADEGAVYSLLTGGTTRYVVLRSDVDTATVMPSLRAAVREIDPSLAVSNVATIDDLVSESLETPRSLSMLIGALATVALLLASIGIYGIMSYDVQQQARDMGIRIALGGSPASVGSAVVGQGMRVVVGGVVVGLTTAALLTHLMSSLLFGIDAGDPASFAVATCVLVAAALVACIVPAGRVVRIDPASVLRNE